MASKYQVFLSVRGAPEGNLNKQRSFLTKSFFPSWNSAPAATASSVWTTWGAQAPACLLVSFQKK